MKNKRITQRDYLKAHRKASREAEIETHGRPVNISRVHRSKKNYDRKSMKADDKKRLLFCFSSLRPKRTGMECAA